MYAVTVRAEKTQRRGWGRPVAACTRDDPSPGGSGSPARIHAVAHRPIGGNRRIVIAELMAVQRNDVVAWMGGVPLINTEEVSERAG